MAHIPEQWKSTVEMNHKLSMCESSYGVWIKLLDDAMKMVGKVIECRIRRPADRDVQFGKVTTVAVCVVKQLQDIFRVKSKKLFFGFIDLEKAFDRVSRELK